MRHLFLTTAAAAVLLISGCTVFPSSSPSSGGTTAGSAPAPRPIERCNAQGAQWAVGKTNTEHNVAEARKRAGAYVVRVLRPGQPTTREFNAERLNLEVDATGRIIAARCG
ncbi:MAG: I78 family peptidase inhibitor [Comamonas sp.]